MSSFRFRLGTITAALMIFLGVALFPFPLTAQAPAQDSTQTLADPNQQTPTLSILSREVLLDIAVTDKAGCRLRRHRRRRPATPLPP
ncbi:MAG: hypothetical protein ABR987_16585 [Terracidiphilus sp.]